MQTLSLAKVHSREEGLHTVSFRVDASSDCVAISKILIKVCLV